MQRGVIYKVFSKDLDRIERGILIVELHNLGVSESLINLLLYYLSTKKQDMLSNAMQLTTKVITKKITNEI